MDRETNIKIEYYLDELQKNKQKDYNISLKEHLSSLEYILCFLKNSAKENPEGRIKEFCEKLTASSSLLCSEVVDSMKKPTVVSQVKLKNVISLYETFEKRYFSFVAQSIRHEYKSQENKDEVEKAVKKLMDDSEDSNTQTSKNPQALIPKRVDI